jgi:single stranded DNA-binding protein
MPQIAAALPYLREVSRTPRGWLARCPFHPDGGRRNLHLYADTDSFYCFRCGVGGSAARFFALLGVDPGVGDAAPVDRGESSTGGFPTEPVDDAGRRRALAVAVAVGEAVRRASPVARAYLAARGVPPDLQDRFRLGYADGLSLAPALRREGGKALVETARRVGLLTRHGEEALAGRVLIPELRGGAPVFVTGRAVSPDLTPRYRSVRGRRVLFFREAALATPGPLFLVEGPFDALALWAAGFPAVALGGSPSRAVLGEMPPGRSLVFLPDTDPAGQDLAGRLRQTIPHLRVRPLPSGVADPAEFLVRHGPAAVRAWLTAEHDSEEENQMDPRILLIAHLGAAPEMKYTVNGRPVLRFRCAVNIRRGGGQNGEPQEEAFWFTVDLFGAAAERLADRLQKGTRVLVDGRFRPRRYTRQDGSEGLAFEIVADRVVPLERTAAPTPETIEREEVAEEEDVPF